MQSKYRSVISVDPGKTTGAAVFFDGVLWTASHSRLGLHVLPEVPMLPAIVVVEKPRVYPHGGKGDQNDLIDLGVMAGEIVGWYRARNRIDHKYVTPCQWKGSVPKPIHNKRVLAALKQEEVEKLPMKIDKRFRPENRPKPKGYDHNMLDAVGIGLFQLGRI